MPDARCPHRNYQVRRALAFESNWFLTPRHVRRAGAYLNSLELPRVRRACPCLHQLPPSISRARFHWPPRNRCLFLRRRHSGPQLLPEAMMENEARAPSPRARAPPTCAVGGAQRLLEPRRMRGRSELRRDEMFLLQEANAGGAASPAGALSPLSLRSVRMTLARRMRSPPCSCVEARATAASNTALS